MARSLFQKLPIKPVDLFEERRGEALCAPRKHSMIVTLIALLVCAAFCIGVTAVAWLIIGTLTMYQF
jgi:hypothetical protein